MYSASFSHSGVQESGVESRRTNLAIDESEFHSGPNSALELVQANFLSLDPLGEFCGEQFTNFWGQSNDCEFRSVICDEPNTPSAPCVDRLYPFVPNFVPFCPLAQETPLEPREQIKKSKRETKKHLDQKQDTKEPNTNFVMSVRARRLDCVSPELNKFEVELIKSQNEINLNVKPIIQFKKPVLRKKSTSMEIIENPKIKK